MIGTYITTDSDVIRMTSSRAISQHVTYQTLLDQHAEEDGVADLLEGVEYCGAQVRVLYHVVQLSVIVAKHTCQTHTGRR